MPAATETLARQRRLLLSLYDAAVAAVHPARSLPPLLPPPPPKGRVLVFSCGKAAGSMMAAAENHYRTAFGLGPDRLGGLGVARHGYEGPPGLIPVIGAGHPEHETVGREHAVARDDGCLGVHLLAERARELDRLQPGTEGLRERAIDGALEPPLEVVQYAHSLPLPACQLHAC